jgi:hypothetical protein
MTKDNEYYNPTWRDNVTVVKSRLLKWWTKFVMTPALGIIMIWESSK